MADLKLQEPRPEGTNQTRRSPPARSHALHFPTAFLRSQFQEKPKKTGTEPDRVHNPYLLTSRETRFTWSQNTRRHKTTRLTQFCGVGASVGPPTPAPLCERPRRPKNAFDGCTTSTFGYACVQIISKCLNHPCGVTDKPSLDWYQTLLMKRGFPDAFLDHSLMSLTCKKCLKKTMALVIHK